MSQFTLHEVGPRDGLQGEGLVVPLDLKEKWIRILMASGLDLVQAGSFVNPGKVPQMADTDELFRRLLGTPGPRARLSGLVLNEQGLDRALAAGVELICMGVSASESHSLRNTGMGTEEALGRILAMAAAARDAGRQVQVSVQSAFGCGFEGPVPESRVLGIVQAYGEAGLPSVSLADTAGHAHPEQVKRLFEAVRGLPAPPLHLTAHFHDTYGLGMANVYAAMESGATAFETSFAGLGGCPFTKVAAGNVATEDLVHALNRTGLRRDIQIAPLLELAREAAGFFGRDMTGRVHRTGPLRY